MNSFALRNNVRHSSKEKQKSVLNLELLIRIVYNCAKNGELRKLCSCLQAVSPETIKDVLHAKTHGCTPLIIACKNGHMNIIRILVKEFHVDIEQSVISGGDIEIPNRHGHTCLMIACYRGHKHVVEYLIKMNADVNKRSVRGNTALHDCAEAGHLDILRVLLKAAALMGKDDYQVTPLLAAAASANHRIVLFLSELETCSKSDRVNALELLGATYVDKKRDLPSALKFWKLALAIRHVEPICLKPEEQLTLAGFREANDLSELEEFFSDPDSLRMQALLIRQRVLGPTHPDTSYFIRFRGAVYADMGRFDLCIDLWKYALNTQIIHSTPLNSLTLSNFLSFAELFIYLIHPSNDIRAELKTSDLAFVLGRMLDQLKRGMAAAGTDLENSAAFDRALLISVHLLCIVARLLPSMTLEERQTMKNKAYEFALLKARLSSSGATLLHMACLGKTSKVGKYPVCSFPSVELVELLLEVGANGNAVTTDTKHSALHCAANNLTPQSEIMGILMGSGVHFDQVDLEGQTAMEIFDSRAHTVGSGMNAFRFDTLQCASARRIVASNLPYCYLLPKRLANFVRLHDSSSYL